MFVWQVTIERTKELALLERKKMAENISTGNHVHTVDMNLAYGPKSRTEMTLICITSSPQVRELDEVIKRYVGDPEELEIIYRDVKCLGVPLMSPEI